MSAGTQAPDLLAALVAAARATVAARKLRHPPAEVRALADVRRPRPGRFREALALATHVTVIAECKRRSPAKGVLRPAYDPAAIARMYEAAGAAAISVLTEPTFFDGSLRHLEAVRMAVALPLLRKDFIVEDYQLDEALAAGADAVLLIARALEGAELERLLARATATGLDALVEVHDAGELARAIDAGASMVGVNSRDLRTLEVDRRVLEDLIPQIPAGIVAVAESGLRSAEDLRALRSAGYDAFLIGERLMTRPHPGEELAALLAAANVANVEDARVGALSRGRRPAAAVRRPESEPLNPEP